jgi:hypothetical protein
MNHEDADISYLNATHLASLQYNTRIRLSRNRYGKRYKFQVSMLSIPKSTISERDLSPLPDITPFRQLCHSRKSVNDGR